VVRLVARSVAFALLVPLLAGCASPQPADVTPDYLPSVAPAPLPKPQPPQVEVTGLHVASDHALVAWRVRGASSAAQTSVEYASATTSLASVAQAGSGDFSATLTGLQPNRTYTYRVVLLDGAWAVRGPAANFTTPEPSSGGPQGPMVAGIVWAPTADGYSIRWEVQGPGDLRSQVRYSAPGIQPLETPLQAGEGTHAAILKDLAAGRQYSFQVILHADGARIESPPTRLSATPGTYTPPPAAPPVTPPAQAIEVSACAASHTREPNGLVPYANDARIAVQSDGSVRIQASHDPDVTMVVDGEPPLHPTMVQAGERTFGLPSPGEGLWLYTLCTDNGPGRWTYSPGLIAALTAEGHGFGLRILDDAQQCFEARPSSHFGASPAVTFRYGPTTALGSQSTASGSVAQACTVAGLNGFLSVRVEGNGLALETGPLPVLSRATLEATVSPLGVLSVPDAAAADRPLELRLRNLDDEGHAVIVEGTGLRIPTTAPGTTRTIGSNPTTTTLVSGARVYESLPAGTYTLQCLIHPAMSDTFTLT
jgi:hypothetical protein